MADIKKGMSNVPNLRFPEFEAEWEEKKLEELCEIITGSTPPTSDETYYGGEYLFVSPADIQANRYIEETKTTLTQKGYEKGRKVRKGSSLFVCIGSTIGKLGQAKENCITNQQINAVTTYREDDNFIFSLLENYSPRIKLLSAEQAVPIINKTTFSNVQIKVPALKEQRKIGSFISLIDERIHTQSKIIENLKVQMLGLQEKIFRRKITMVDKNGNDFPEWETRNGGDLFYSTSNKRHNSDLPILAITQDQGAVPRDSIDYKISVTDKSVESYKVVEIGDFIISLRSFQGGIEYSNHYGICSPAYIILKNKHEVEKLFYKYYFKTADYIKLLNKKLEGIRDGKMISYTYFSEIPLPYPSVEEQTKIAKMLFCFEKKIELENCILKEYENQKQYLLQNLFI